jgi:hypothetical protein
MAPILILDMPTDDSVRFHPTKILYVVPRSNWAKKTSVLDLTDQLYDSFHDDFTPEFHSSARRLVMASPPPPSFLSLTRNHWYSSSHVAVVDATGAKVAEWYSPAMSYGDTTVTFPEDSTHSDHPLSLKALKLTQRAQSFVKDSITYVWVAEKRFKSGSLTLYKASASKKVEVARYQSESGSFVTGGPLVVVTNEVDEVVALLTCLAVLSQRDTGILPQLKA